MDIQKLENWVNTHPKEADLRSINITTGKSYSVREMLVLFKKEEDTHSYKTDEEHFIIKRQMEAWLDTIK